MLLEIYLTVLPPTTEFIDTTFFLFFLIYFIKHRIVGGLPTTDPRHAQYVADFAILVSHAVKAAVRDPTDVSPINIRIGIHSGPVMAGVVGNIMPRYASHCTKLVQFLCAYSICIVVTVLFYIQLDCVLALHVSHYFLSFDFTIHCFV